MLHIAGSQNTFLTTIQTSLMRAERFTVSTSKMRPLFEPAGAAGGATKDRLLTSARQEPVSPARTAFSSEVDSPDELRCRGTP